MKITVFGPTGPTGIEVLKQALEAGYFVTAYARNPAKIGSLTDANLAVKKAELSDMAALESAIQGTDAVISVLGPGVGLKGTELSRGMKNIVDCMKKCGVRRLIALSTGSVRDPQDKFDMKFKCLVFMIRTLFNGAYQEIIRMGDIIRGSGLEWTLVRVGLLTNKDISKAKAGYYGEGIVKTSVSRKSVAKFMLDILRVKAYIQKAPAISN